MSYLLIVFFSLCIEQTHLTFFFHHIWQRVLVPSEFKQLSTIRVLGLSWGSSFFAMCLLTYFLNWLKSFLLHNCTKFCNYLPNIVHWLEHRRDLKFVRNSATKMHHKLGELSSFSCQLRIRLGIPRRLSRVLVWNIPHSLDVTV
jgi:hypothetical protein